MYQYFNYRFDRLYLIDLMWPMFYNRLLDSLHYYFLDSL